MLKTVKKALILCMSALMAVAGAGCASQSNATESKAATGTKTVVVWYGGTSDAETAYYESMFKKIDEANAGFTIKLVNQSSITDSITAAITSNDLPDITLVDGTNIAGYVFNGILEPLDSYMTSTISDDMLASIKSEITYESKIYAIAQFDSGLSFWANKSMFDKAGIKLPTSYKDAWTKSQFEDVLTEP